MSYEMLITRNDFTSSSIRHDGSSRNDTRYAGIAIITFLLKRSLSHSRSLREQ